jgi:RNase P subunit RPR2
MKPMLRDPDRHPEIPLTPCPNCQSAGYMAIKTIRPRLRHRDGIEVEYACPKCQTVLVSSISAQS